jgi:hypothetical protein
MYHAEITIEGISTYSPGKVIASARKKQESADDHDERCWKERCTVGDDDIVCVPRMAFKLALESAAIFSGEKIVGKGNATYSKHFCQGVLAVEDIPLGIRLADVECEKLFVPSDGKRAIMARGGSKRVMRRFPVIYPPWKAVVRLVVVDETITPEVMKKMCCDAGLYIGLGRFRPQVGGYNGRFKVTKFVTKRDE